MRRLKKLGEGKNGKGVNQGHEREFTQFPQGFDAKSA